MDCCNHSSFYDSHCLAPIRLIKLINQLIGLLEKTSGAPSVEAVLDLKWKEKIDGREREE